MEETNIEFKRRLGIDYNSYECIQKYQQWSDKIRKDFSKNTETIETSSATISTKKKRLVYIDSIKPEEEQ